MKALLTALIIVAATLGASMPSLAECYLPYNARPDLRMLWLQKDCRYWFPQRDGFVGRPKAVVLRAGTVIDRFGQPTGNFLAPAEASYMGRLKMPYYRYEVVRPVRVQAGKAAPWFDQPGGGMQYKTAVPVKALIDSGHLRQVW